MKYSPKTAFRVRMPGGRDRTVFTRGSLTPRGVLQELGLDEHHEVLEYQGRVLDPDVPLTEQGLKHEAVVAVAGVVDEEQAAVPWWHRRLLPGK